MMTCSSVAVIQLANCSGSDVGWQNTLLIDNGENEQYMKLVLV